MYEDDHLEAEYEARHDWLDDPDADADYADEADDYDIHDDAESPVVLDWVPTPRYDRRHEEWGDDVPF